MYASVLDKLASSSSCTRKQIVFSCCLRIVVGGCSKGRVQCLVRRCQLEVQAAVSIRQMCRFDTFGGCGDVTDLPVELFHVGEVHGLFFTNGQERFVDQ